MPPGTLEPVFATVLKLTRTKTKGGVITRDVAIFVVMDVIRVDGLRTDVLLLRCQPTNASCLRAGMRVVLLLCSKRKLTGAPC